MTIDATLLGQILLVSAVITAVFGFILGRTKTTSPRLSATLGFFGGLFQPIGIIYLMILLLKNDVVKQPS